MKGLEDSELYDFTATIYGCIYGDKDKVPTAEEIKGYIKDDINELLLDMEISDIKKI